MANALENNNRNMKRGKVKKGNNSYKVDVKKFVIFIIVVLVIITIIICIFSKPKVSDNTNMSKLNSSKYSEQILEEYEKGGMMEEFLSDYEKIQTAIGMYILNNSTMDNDSFSNISKDLNKELAKKNWESIEVVKPTTWNGEWTVDDEGKLKFKFDNKDIEPSWISNEQVEDKILRN